MRPHLHKFLIKRILVLTGVSTVYYANKDSVFPTLKPHHALSFFSKKSTDLELGDCITETITNEKELQEKKTQMRYRMEAYITNLQGQIIKTLEGIETDGKFKVDRWLREEGGGGITCILQDGAVFERAAVNVSVVSGTLPPAAVAQMRSR
jgi:coproporphyrinogen III oxidase